MANNKDEQLDRFIADLWSAMVRIIKNTRNMGGTVADTYDLTQPQMFTLWQLKERGALTMGELADRLSVTHGVATRMVDRLLAKGMVERRGDPDDRRVVVISLTQLGEDVTAAIVADALVIIRDVFRDVSQKDREEYLALLGRIEKAQAGEAGE